MLNTLTEPGNLIVPFNPQIKVPSRGPLIKVPDASRWKRDTAIQDMIDYFDEDDYRDRWDVVNENSNELKAIEEEILKCQRDFVYAARNYFYIVDTHKRDVPLLLREPQEIIFEEMLSMKAAGIAQKIQILKSRQLGCSTLIEALVAWATMFHPNRTAYVISYAKNHAQDLFAMMTNILDKMPWWLRPMVSKRTYEEGLIFNNPSTTHRREIPGLNSKVKVGSQATGCIGRGDTISALHLSEYAFYDQDLARDIIEGDLKAALHENTETFAFLESTGKGAGSYSHDLWRKNKKLAEKADFRTLFLPWFFDRVHVIPPPQGWVIQEPEQKMRDRVSTEWVVCSNRDCARHHESFRSGERTEGLTCHYCGIGTLVPLWLTDEQMVWMWKRRINADGLEEIKKLRSEQCTTDEEAWIVSGVQIFPDQVMQVAAQCVQPPLAIGNMDRAGNFHGVLRIIRNESGFEIGSTCWNETCSADHRFNEAPLMIWEFPKPGCQYAIGADVAEGIRQDYSVCCVNRIGVSPNPDVQVALYRSNEVGAIDFATPIDLMGRWFNDAQVAVEYNIYTSCGDELRLRKEYPNLYRWKHLDSVTGFLSNKWHWYTNYKSKSKLWQTGVRRIKSGDYIPRSQNLIEEMKTFTKDEFDSQSASANRGFYDDEIMATLIAVYTAHETDFDENLGYIPAKNKQEGIQEDAAWLMECPRCNATWEWDRPDQDAGGCPTCHYKIIKGNRRALQAVPGGSVMYEKLIEEMTTRVQAEMAENRSVDDIMNGTYDRF